MRHCRLPVAVLLGGLAIGGLFIAWPKSDPAAVPSDEEAVAEADRLDTQLRLTADRKALSDALVNDLIGGRAELSSTAYRLTDMASVSPQYLTGLRFTFPAPSAVESQAQAMIHQVYVELADRRGDSDRAAAVTARLRTEYRAAFGAAPPTHVGTGRTGTG